MSDDLLAAFQVCWKAAAPAAALGIGPGTPNVPGPRSMVQEVPKQEGQVQGKRQCCTSLKTGTAPMYFSLGEAEDDEQAFCNMVQQDPQNEELNMEQDAGFTEGDLRRKVAKPEDWEVVQQKSQGYATEPAVEAPWKSDCTDEMPQAAVRVKNLRVHYIPSLEAGCPNGLLDGSLSQRQLQNECEKWAIQVSGTKAVLESSFELFFESKAMQQKGCTMKFVQLKVGNPLHLRSVESGPSPSVSQRPRLEIRRPLPLLLTGQVLPRAGPSLGHCYQALRGPRPAVPR